MQKKYVYIVYSLVINEERKEIEILGTFNNKEIAKKCYLDNIQDNIENYNFVVDKNCNKLTLDYYTSVTRLFYKQENNFNNYLEFYIKRVEVE